MRRIVATLCIALAAPAIGGAALAAAASPGLGRPATADEIARADISIDPEGANLPAGSGGVAAGKAVFEARCLACHGAAGVGGPMDRLTGGVGTVGKPGQIVTISSYWPYATTLFDYIRRAMPLTEPRSLSDDEVYAVTAYLLSVDGVVAPDAVMDAKSLPKVRMPNRDGFVSLEHRLEGPQASR